MPEGPEVRAITDKLSAKLTGTTLIGMGWDQSSKYSNGLPKYDQLSICLPMTVEDVTCKGKQIFFRFSKEYLLNDQRYTHRVYLNSTLGLEGKWSWTRGTHSNFWLVIGRRIENLYGSLDLIIDRQVIYFDDSRHFGNITLMSEHEYQEKLRKIGPDLLAENISLDRWEKEFRSTRRYKMQICEFLMKQEYFSGIGNYLKSEILYRSRIKPDRILSNISDGEMSHILQKSMEILRESYSYNGLTIRSYSDPDGEKGTFPRQIYERDVDSLGNKIIKSKFKDGRTTHWVPEIQH